MRRKIYLKADSAKVFRTKGGLFSKAIIVYMWSERVVPTAPQGIQCMIQCQWLTNMFQVIHIVRFDERTKNVYILSDGDVAGEIELEIFPDGNWSFTDEN
jgi:hypothetical protein